MPPARTVGIETLLVGSSVQGSIGKLGVDSVGFGDGSAGAGSALSNVSGQLRVGLTVAIVLLVGQVAEGNLELFKVHAAFSLDEGLKLRQPEGSKVKKETTGKWRGKEGTAVIQQERRGGNHESGAATR